VIAILLLLVFLLPLLGPLGAYHYGRHRAGRRSEAARQYFEQQHRRAIRIYCWFAAASVTVILVTAVVAIRLGSGRVIDSVVQSLMCFAGSLMMVLIAFGITITGMCLTVCRERIPGHCVKCDYNLRGTMSGRCPECGHWIEARFHRDHLVEP